ncbi:MULTISPECIES: ATP-binding protein [unclassified Spirosoma]|uniref:sensor histidine kinase n=1 Tax=unclassified Spirosoma TaxID=2621999 RepID=UPI00095DD46D|nr:MULTISPECIES: ATP-binding protein [unclassified Spirosoma]MBN8826090.1 PAS domain-containing protein [Spirosoma sp.]OJW74577.1 MAG: histidine kinase [Spirosoma sp. 48-14]
MHISFRTRYLLYIIAVHVAIAGLLYLLLQQNKPWFIASELGLLLSIYMAVSIYRQFQQPSEFIASGIEAIRDKDFTVKFVPTGNREVDELITVYNLMIDQLRQERTRQIEQQFFLEKLIEAAPIAILIFDFDGQIASINPRACQLLSVQPDDVVGKPLDQIGFSLLAQMADMTDGDSRVMKPNGIETYKVQRSNFMDRGFRRSFLIIEELTPEILATEKSAYSKVIRMMAHEVNNSIGAVNSILGVTQSYVDEPDVQHALRVAVERNDRLNHFMRRFADVVRLPQPQRQSADVNDIARNVVRLMQQQAEGKQVSLTYKSEGANAQSVDVEQLEQVLVNIIKNALEACKSGDQVDVFGAANALIIRDNGQPIPESAVANLFNPFYSTKPDGQGIGLTVTREILLNHHVQFSLQTKPDGWTEFLIEFP